MTNALDPDLMTAEERLDEVAELLAMGILRRRNCRRKAERFREKALELSAGLSPDGTREKRT